VLFTVEQVLVRLEGSAGRGGSDDIDIERLPLL
jgi:hypothetical protein